VSSSRRKKLERRKGTSWSQGTDKTQKFVYDGWNVVLVLNHDNETLRKYTWGLDLSQTVHEAGGIGGVLACLETQGTSTTTDDKKYWFCYDANGNVGQVLEYDDKDFVTVAARYEYDPYGNVIAMDDPDGNGYDEINPFRFSTKWLDTELAGPNINGAIGDTGLYYFGYRYYSPRLGRWLNRDPIGESGARIIRHRSADTESFSWLIQGGGVWSGSVARDTMLEQEDLYRYADNAPSDRFDSFGLQTTQPSSQPACVCGPDVTDAIDRLLKDVDLKLDALLPRERDSLCDGFISAGGWDTHLFTGGTGFKRENCPKGKECQYDHSNPGVSGGMPVTVRGRCHFSFDVNYVLFGRVAKKCGRWAEVKAVVAIYAWKLRNGSLERLVNALYWYEYGTGSRKWVIPPRHLLKCAPCSERWTESIPWHVYGDDGVSIRG